MIEQKPHPIETLKIGISQEVHGAICIEMTSSLPVLCKKENVSYTRDYNEDIHEKYKSESALLKICTKRLFASLSNLPVVKRKRTVSIAVQIFNKVDFDLFFS